MDKQQEILSAALQLFVANGFHGTATSKIAKEAGVANGTLFHY
jgi:AcrR family transcriptional regulator